MKLLKPLWMSNNDKPIFSIDIHPDNSRCATAVQGAAMGIGEIIIWNMGPIRDEDLEKDPNVPSVLCRMENHNACVNCVRWSLDGRYLASASDDKLVIVWHCLRSGDEGASFGNKNIETWKAAATLRGHSGDVLDLSWSANLQWLASCSVDNTIIIWNVAKMPEQLTTLKRHTSMVKGVSFDPTASYLASHSDDQSVKIWRTYDWKEIKSITEPYASSSVNSHLLRLDWSPDGDSLVTTNAVNNSFPVAQIIERTDWNTRLDMVGHRKPTTCVRYNTRLFMPIKGKKRRISSRPHHAICGVGSKDRSLSIWSTNLGRPVAVIHDLFKSSLLDISWSHSGLEMVCCSWDGTVAYVSFSEEEVGVPIPQKEKEAILEKMYGKTALNYRGKSLKRPLICETVEQLSLLEGDDEYEGLSEAQKHKRIARELQAQHSKDLMALYEKKHPRSGHPQLEEGKKKKDSSAEALKQPEVRPQVLEGGVEGVSQDVSQSSKSPNKQIETRTKDGKRKIMPIFLSYQSNIAGETPLPFTTSIEPSFSSSKESSTIVVEKQNTILQQQQNNTIQQLQQQNNLLQQQLQQLQSNGQQADQVQSSVVSIFNTAITAIPTTLNSTLTPQTVCHTATTTTVTCTTAVNPASLQGDVHAFLDRKRDSKGRVKATQVSNNTCTNNRLEAASSDVIPQQAHDTISATVPCTSLAPRLFSIPALEAIKDNRTLVVSKSQIEGTLSIECNNSHSHLTRSQSINRLKAVRNGRVLWQSILSLPVVAFTANSQFIVAITSDHTLHTFKTTSGRSTHPPVQMDSPPSLLKINSSFIMVVNSRGNLFVWDLMRPACLIRNESLESLFSVKSENLRIFQAMITDQGIPIISLSNGRSYSYDRDFQNWVLVSSVTDFTTLLSDFSTPVSDQSTLSQGSVLHNISKKKRGLDRTWEALGCDSSVQCLATLAHLESKVNSSIALKLPEDFQIWIMNYVRYLVKFNLDLRLRDILQELINPFLKGVESSEDIEVLGLSKEELFKNILEITRENHNLQKLYKEFQSQLESFDLIQP